MIFVTGGTGLVGSHLLHDLVKKGHAVRALFRNRHTQNDTEKIFSYYAGSANNLFSKIEWVEGDLLDITSLMEGMKDVTQVYHCAGLVSLSDKEEDNMMRANVTGTANVVNAALEMKIGKLCYVSSVASLGIEKGKDITEEIPWNNEAYSSAYTVSKYLAEIEVWRGIQEGLNAVIVNPTIIIGPGNKQRSSALLFQKERKGINWYSSGSMGFVDVRDVVKAMQQLTESEVVNQRFILTAENLSYKKFFALLNTSLGMPAPTKYAGRITLSIAWRADKLRSMITSTPHHFTKAVANNAAAKLSYSNKKIKSLLHIHFIPVEESIKNTSTYILESELSNP